MVTNGLARSLLAMLAVGGGITGCATPGTKPHDMSVAGHKTAASAAEAEAAQHARTEVCRPSTKPCWTTAHDTAEERRIAEYYRDRAAKHRAAAQALRDAEVRSCAGIPELDRDLSPFIHREDITGVTPIYLTSAPGYAVPSNLRGAVVTIRAVPGLTTEWLQRTVDCHLARNAALGHPLDEMPDCPLVPKGVTARARPAGDRFEVEIRANDAATAAEVWKRARRLVSTQQ